MLRCDPNVVDANVVVSSLKVILVSSGCFFCLLASLHAQSKAPELECTVKNCLNHAGGNAIPAVCDVANGEEIEIHIALKTTPFDPLTAPSLSPKPIPPQGEYFLLKVIRDSDGTEMPIKINKTGGGKNLNLFTEEIYLEIPEPKKVRQAKAQAAWNKAKVQHTEANHWDVKDADMADALEKDLIENQVGHYKIICSYISNKPGTWKGEVNCAPLEINVLDKGTSLDRITNL